MSDDKTVPGAGGDADRPDLTQPLPAADRPDLTQPLPAADRPDLTQELPADTTRPLGPTVPEREPTRGDDPLSIFDEPVSQPPTGTPDAPGAGDAPTYPGAPVPDAPAPVGTAARRSGPRPSTVVWGFIVVAVGIGIVATGAGAHLDVELAAIVLLAAAGVLLVIGSVVGAARRRRRTPTA